MFLYYLLNEIWFYLPKDYCSSHVNEPVDAVDGRNSAVSSPPADDPGIATRNRFGYIQHSATWHRPNKSPIPLGP